MPYAFLIELQTRPDGVVNQSINHYSTLATTLATFHQRVASALTTTQFTKVFLQVIDNEGVIYENRLVETQYVAPEEEPEE